MRKPKQDASSPQPILEAASLLTVLVAVLLSNPYSSEAFEANRFVFLWVAAGLMLLGCSREYLPGMTLRKDRLSMTALVFLGVTLLAAATSILPSRSLWGVLPRLHGLVSVLALGIFLLAGRLTGENPDLRRRLSQTLIFAASVASAYALAQRLGFDPILLTGGWPDRVTGTQGNPIFLGAILAIALPWTLGAILNKDPIGWKLYGHLTLQLMALVWTGSRGPQLAAILGVVVTLLATRRLAVSPKWLAIGSLGLLALLSLTLFTGERRNWRTLEERQLIWAASLETISQSSPARQILGHGPDTFPWVVSPRLPAALPAKAARPDATYDRAHQSLLQLGVEVGLLGVLTWLLMLGTAALALLNLEGLRGPTILGAGLGLGGMLGYFQAPEFLGLGAGLGGLLALFILLLQQKDRLSITYASMLGALVAYFAHTLVAPRSAGSEALIWLLLGVFVPTLHSHLDKAPSKKPAPLPPERLSLPTLITAASIMSLGLWTPPQVTSGPRYGLALALVLVVIPAILSGVSFKLWRFWIPGLLLWIAFIRWAPGAESSFTLPVVLVSALLVAFAGFIRSRGGTLWALGPKKPRVLGALLLAVVSVGISVSLLATFTAMHRGDTAAADGEFAGAIQQYQQALATFPQCDTCLLASFRARIRAVPAARWEESPRLVAIDRDLKNAARANPYEPNFPRERAYLQARWAQQSPSPAARRRHLREAEEQFAEAARLSPTDSRLRRLWANLLLDDGRPEEALVIIQEAVSLSPTSADGHLMLARTWLDLGDPYGAWASMQKALDLDFSRVRKVVSAMASSQPPQWRALRDWALVAALTGRLPEAQEVLRRSRTLAPASEEESLSKLERALRELG